MALLLSSCAYTIQAVERLPEGYWSATWNLVDGVLSDLWHLMEIIL